jgi:asparagine synthase (glutamine-hydrolysing)
MDRVLRVDYATYLVEDILVKVDRAAMRNSLEVRSPFLDREVVEFAFGAVPWWLKVSPEARKILLGLLATRLLPAEFDPTRKHGFSVPLEEWLTRGASKELLQDALLSREACFERTAIRKLLARQHGGFSNAERLFGLAQFELWRREYAITI